MSKKRLIIRTVIIVILLALLLPAFSMRIKYEKENKDVLFALNYNNAAMNLSGEELKETLAKNKEFGVCTAVVAEESLNSLINGGLVSAIKYNVLCHKYDDESEDIIKKLSGNDKIHNDSYVLITKRTEWKEFLNRWITSKYAEDEYVKVTSSSDADVYVVYEGVSDAWHIPVGFDEAKLEGAEKSGFNIVLSMMLSAYTNTEYIAEVEKLIDKYNVSMINLKKSYGDQSQDEDAEKNYTAFCEMIQKKGLYLILTEEQTQLSNQKPIGYDALVNAAEGRVLRGYETADFELENTGATIYEKRYTQIVNSVVDRNIRFVVINQLTNGTDSIADKSKKTNDATGFAITKLREIGFNTDSYDTLFAGYSTNRRLVSAVAMVIMIFMALMMIEWLSGKYMKVLEIIAAAGAVLSVPFTYFFVPYNILLLYPTLFAAVAPCFAITAVMIMAKKAKDKMKPWLFVLSSVLLALGILLLCVMVQCALLSGLDYYLNSLIFRGIKISLILPIAYSVVAYSIIFANTSEKLYKRVLKMLNADIKVYWMLIAAVVGGVAVIYLIRSGNVSSISGAESFMRNTITEIMPARPRTKEFLVGWPCLFLFLYYMKNTDCKLLQWCFAVGSSILFASVINTSCHVFTSAEVIFTRVLNGLLLGAIISAGLIVVSYFIIKLVRKYCKAGNDDG